jgi:hypothetical protein
VGGVSLSQRDEIDWSNWKDYEEDVKSLCLAKAAEFHLLGYEEVTAKEVWQCVQGMVKQDDLHLYQMVELVMGLNIGKFMNFMTLSAYKGSFGDDLV